VFSQRLSSFSIHSCSDTNSSFNDPEGKMWEEHCRDYQNRIAPPEQYNSENLPVDPTEHAVLEATGGSSNPNGSLVIASNNLSSLQSDAHRLLAARIRDHHRKISAERAAPGQFIPSPISFSETTAFDGKNILPMLMA
jgi:hypothetical protein